MQLSLLLAAARGRQRADALLAAVDGGATNGMHTAVDHSNVPMPAPPATPGASAAPKSEAPEFRESTNSTAMVGQGNTGKWTREEDRLLLTLVAEYGTRSWQRFAHHLGRTGKACRERWVNQVNPEINHGPWTIEEENILVQAHAEFGNQWTEIARILPGRTDNSIKNRWNAAKRRMVRKCGVRGNDTKASLLRRTNSTTSTNSSDSTTTTTTTTTTTSNDDSSSQSLGNPLGQALIAARIAQTQNQAWPMVSFLPATASSSTTMPSEAASSYPQSPMRASSFSSSSSSSSSFSSSSCSSLPSTLAQVLSSQYQQQHQHHQHQHQQQQPQSIPPFEWSASQGVIPEHSFVLAMPQPAAAAAAAAVVVPPAVSVLDRLHKGRGGKAHKEEEEGQQRGEGQHLLLPQASSRLYIGHGINGSSSSSMRLCANVSTWTGSRNLQPARPRMEEEESSEEEEEEEEVRQREQQLKFQQQYKQRQQQQLHHYYQQQQQQQQQLQQQHHAMDLALFTSDMGEGEQQWLYHQQQQQQQQRQQEHGEESGRSSHPKKWHKRAGDAGGMVIVRKQFAMDAVRSLGMLRRAVEEAAAREMRG